MVVACAPICGVSGLSPPGNAEPPLAPTAHDPYLNPYMTNTFDRLKSALADRYAIEEELGAGGMATVYLAEDLKHHRKVAVKVLRPELAAVLGAERFVQEIETTANLQHPHILPLFDSGEADSGLSTCLESGLSESGSHWEDPPRFPSHRCEKSGTRRCLTIRGHAVSRTRDRDHLSAICDHNREGPCRGCSKAGRARCWEGNHNSHADPLCWISLIHRITIPSQSAGERES